MPGPSEKARRRDRLAVPGGATAPIRGGEWERGRLRGPRSDGLASGGVYPRRLRPTAAALDHAQGIAAFTARLAAEFIHQRSHEENATAADAQFGRVEVR